MGRLLSVNLAEALLCCPENTLVLRLPCAICR